MSNRNAFYSSGLKQVTRIGLVLLASATLMGCNLASRLAAVGEEPEMAQIENPTHQPDYQPVSMPMPAPIPARPMPNSLWRPGSRHFLKDLRASRVGDIVTVNISINESASFSNDSTRTRTNTDNLDVDSILGYEAHLDKILPEAVNPADIWATDSALSNAGTGQIDRTEAITVKLAAVVTQVLPNGNLVIRGTQETRINYDIRELAITGIIRPQDIDSSNEVDYDQIAEARLAYGGRGQMMDMQQPRYGSQIMDILLPF